VLLGKKVEGLEQRRGTGACGTSVPNRPIKRKEIWRIRKKPKREELERRNVIIFDWLTADTGAKGNTQRIINIAKQLAAFLKGTKNLAEDWEKRKRKTKKRLGRLKSAVGKGSRVGVIPFKGG